MMIFEIVSLVLVVMLVFYPIVHQPYTSDQQVAYLVCNLILHILSML